MPFRYNFCRDNHENFSFIRPNGLCCVLVNATEKIILSELTDKDKYEVLFISNGQY